MPNPFTQYFNNLANACQELIVITDVDNKIVFANNSICVSLGLGVNVDFSGTNKFINSIKDIFILTGTNKDLFYKPKFDNVPGFLKNINQQIKPILLSKQYLDPENQWAIYTGAYNNKQLSEPTNNNQEAFFEKLYRLVTKTHKNDELMMRDYLNFGCSLFDLETGIISKIDNNLEILAFYGPIKGLEPGKKFNLGNSLSNEVVTGKKIITYLREPNNTQTYKNRILHPLYVAITLERYVGVPLYVADKLYGILEFISAENNEQQSGFSSRNLEMLEILAKLLGKILDTRRIRQELEQMSIEDELTHSLNRRKFNQVVNQEITRLQRFDIGLSLVLLDIDFFKRINDNFGHDVGDKVLLDLSKLVKNYIRKVDMFFRLGGEEFAILFFCDFRQAFSLADKLRVQVSKADFKPCEKVTISLGVTQIYPNDDLRSAFKRADLALYRAKSSGRDQVQLIIGDN